MENSKINKYHISIKQEISYCLDKILDKWIKIHIICPSFNNATLKLKKVKSLPNPLKLQCNQYKCRKSVNLRNNTIFSYFSKTPISF